MAILERKKSPNRRLLDEATNDHNSVVALHADTRDTVLLKETMVSQGHAILLSVFLLFKFLFKDLIIPALIACFIHGIDPRFAMLPPSIKRFLTKELNYKEAVSWNPLIHVSVDFVKSWVLASILGFFFCMWYAAKKYCIANNVLGIFSCIQGIEMLSLGPIKTHTILLFPIADAVWWSSLLSTACTVIPGIFVALALPIAVPGCRKNCFFNCAFLQYGLLNIIMNWFQAARDDTKQLVDRVWDWNIYGAKLNKFDGRVLHIACKDGERGRDDATALPEDGERGGDDATALPEDFRDGAEDGGSGPEDGGSGSSGPEVGGSGPEDGDSGPEDGGSGPDNHDSGLGDSGMVSKDNNDESRQSEPFGQHEPSQSERPGQRAVQLLAISADFPICEICGFDWRQGRCIYVQREGEVQEEGMMVDLVPIGPCGILMAYGYFCVDVYTNNESGPLISEGWDVSEDDEIEEYTHTICPGPGRKFEITYLVIPNAIEVFVEVKLKLKDLGSRSRAVYGKIKVGAIDYRNKRVHLFSCDRATSLSFPSGTASILPLSPSTVAVPWRRQLDLHIEVDLTVITCDSPEEQDNNLRFTLEFTREITSQEREVDGDQVEVNMWCYRFCA